MSPETEHISNAQQRYELEMQACFAAVREGFPHLAVCDIVKPPHEWFDAALARQVAYHLMAYEFHWPRRRIMENEGRSREGLHRGMQRINRRLQTPRFSAHYNWMGHRAHLLLASVSEPSSAEVAA